MSVRLLFFKTNATRCIQLSMLVLMFSVSMIVRSMDIKTLHDLFKYNLINFVPMGPPQITSASLKLFQQGWITTGEGELTLIENSEAALYLQSHIVPQPPVAPPYSDMPFSMEPPQAAHFSPAGFWVPVPAPAFPPPPLMSPHYPPQQGGPYVIDPNFLPPGFIPQGQPVSPVNTAQYPHHPGGYPQSYTMPFESHSIPSGHPIHTVPQGIFIGNDSPPITHHSEGINPPENQSNEEVNKETDESVGPLSEAVTLPVQATETGQSENHEKPKPLSVDQQAFVEDPPDELIITVENTPSHHQTEPITEPSQKPLKPLDKDSSTSADAKDADTTDVGANKPVANNDVVTPSDEVAEAETAVEVVTPATSPTLSIPSSVTEQPLVVATGEQQPGASTSLVPVPVLIHQTDSSEDEMLERKMGISPVPSTTTGEYASKSTLFRGPDKGSNQRGKKKRRKRRGQAKSNAPDDATSLASSVIPERNSISPTKTTPALLKSLIAYPVEQCVKKATPAGRNLRDTTWHCLKKLTSFRSSHKKSRKRIIVPVHLKRSARTEPALLLGVLPVVSTRTITLSTIVAAISAGIGLWYWKYYQPGNDYEGKQGTSPDCKTGQPVVRRACKQASKKNDTTAVSLINLFGQKDLAPDLFPATAVYRHNPAGMIQRTVSLEKKAFFYGVVGYSRVGVSAQQAKNIVDFKTPVYYFSTQFYQNLLLHNAQILASFISPNTLAEYAPGDLDPLSQVMLWCGMPVGEWSRRLHGACIQEIASFINRSGSSWYQQEAHKVYWHTQTSNIFYKPGDKHLLFSPAFQVVRENELSSISYEARILELPDKNGFFSNRYKAYSAHIRLNIRLDNLPSSYNLFSFKNNSKWSLEEEVHDHNSNTLQNLFSNEVYGVGRVNSTVPDRFLTVEKETGVISPAPARMKQPASGDSTTDYFSASSSSYRKHWHFQRPFRTNMEPRSDQFRLNQKDSDINIKNGRSPRSQGLQDLLSHYHSEMTEDKINMVSVFMYDSEPPFGFFVYKETDEKKTAIAFYPFSFLPLQIQINRFNRAFKACTDQWGDCYYSNVDHREFIRFHLAICSVLDEQDCPVSWTDEAQIIDWASLMQMMDWEETIIHVPPMYFPENRFILRPELVRVDNTWNLELAVLRSKTTNQNTDPDEFLLEGQFHCNILNKNPKAPDKKQCFNLQNMTHIVGYLDNVIRLASINSFVEHILVFKQGHLLLPLWNRALFWLNRHLTQHDKIKSNIPERVATTMENDFLEKTKEEKGGCAAMQPENLRQACIMLEDPDHVKRLTDLSSLAHSNLYYPIFQFLGFYTANDQEIAVFDYVKKAHISELPVDRLILHLDMLKRFPILTEVDSAGIQSLVFSGVFEDLSTDNVSITKDDLYQLIYSQLTEILLRQSSSQERFQLKQFMCYQQRLSEEHWCPDSTECLIQVPRWKYNTALNEIDISLRPWLQLSDSRETTFPLGDTTPYTMVFHLPPGRYELDSFFREWFRISPPEKVLSGRFARFVFSNISRGAPTMLFPHNMHSDHNVIFMLKDNTLYRGACDDGYPLEILEE